MVKFAALCVGCTTLWGWLCYCVGMVFVRVVIAMRGCAGLVYCVVLFCCLIRSFALVLVLFGCCCLLGCLLCLLCVLYSDVCDLLYGLVGFVWLCLLLGVVVFCLP